MPNPTQLHHHVSTLHSDKKSPNNPGDSTTTYSCSSTAAHCPPTPRPPAPALLLLLLLLRHHRIETKISRAKSSFHVESDYSTIHSFNQFPPTAWRTAWDVMNMAHS